MEDWLTALVVMVTLLASWLRALQIGHAPVATLICIVIIRRTLHLVAFLTERRRGGSFPLFAIVPIMSSRVTQETFHVIMGGL